VGKAAWEKHFAPLGALNWGYSADRTEHLIWRLQNGDIQRVSPEVAVLLIGTNNTGHEKRAAAETVSGIKRSIEEISWKWPNTKIIVMAVFPRGESTEDQLCQLNSEINQLLPALVDQKRVHLLDINATYLRGETKINRELFPDLLHLSPAAYDIWAAALREKLTELGVK
jgi:lysophospholipase L1-like esterase